MAESRLEVGLIEYIELLEQHSFLIMMNLEIVVKFSLHQISKEDFQKFSSALVQQIKNNECAIANKHEEIFVIKEHRQKQTQYSKRRVGNMSLNDFRKVTTILYDAILPKKCNDCDSSTDITIHHIRYRLPLRESDLVRLCRSCHSKLHLRLRNKETHTP